MRSDTLSARRRDEEGDFHDVISEQCPSCGCTINLAKDDRSIVWEPGLAWDEACRSRSCRCHSEPVSGSRRETGDAGA